MNFDDAAVVGVTNQAADNGDAFGDFVATKADGDVGQAKVFVQGFGFG